MSESIMLTNQLLRGGTFVGANIHESKYAHGTADFISKCKSVLRNAMSQYIDLNFYGERVTYQIISINLSKVPAALSAECLFPPSTQQR